MKSKYQEDYAIENDQMYKTVSEKFKKNKLPIVIIMSILVIGILVYFLFLKGNSRADEEYAALVVTLCDKAMEYELLNDGIIDRSTPGASTFISLQKLVDANLIEGIVMDPRYKKGIFTKGKEIPLSTYIKLTVASNKEIYCEGLEDY
jgi:hypothetical protein